MTLLLLVDDDDGVRESTRALLETAGYAVRDHASAEALLGAPEAGECLITDLRLPKMDGLDLLRELHRRGRDLPIILISGHGDIPTAVRALREGAADFLEKPFEVETLLASIRRALAGPPDPGSSESGAAKTLLERLTPRERDVFDQLIRGRSNKLAAFELGLSPRTVESHRARLLNKLGARSVADLVRISLSAAVISIKV